LDIASLPALDLGGGFAIEAIEQPVDYLLLVCSFSPTPLELFNFMKGKDEVFRSFNPVLLAVQLRRTPILLGPLVQTSKSDHDAEAYVLVILKTTQSNISDIYAAVVTGYQGSSSPMSTVT
jgi:hypothetical protein